MKCRPILFLLALTPATGAAEVTVSYLANEAYLISDGERSVLLDAFVPKPYYGYASLAEADWRAMQAGDEPFHDVVAAFTSHEHADHIQPGAAARFLEGREDLRLFTTPAAVPETVIAAPVAVPADGVLAFLREGGIGTESGYRRAFLTETETLGVIAAGTVAGLTLIPAERRPLVGHDPVRTIQDRQQVRVFLAVVTAQAFVGAAPGVLGQALPLHDSVFGLLRGDHRHRKQNSQHAGCAQRRGTP